MKTLESRPIRIPALILIGLVVLISSAGCARSGKSSQLAGTPTGQEAPKLSGITRTPQPSVTGIVLPDVSPTVAGRPAVPFETKADPGALLVVYFGYTSCPDVCPTSMSDLKSAKRDLGELSGSVTVAMVTVDPQRDTPQVLDSYLSHFFSAYHALRTDDIATLKQAEAAFGASSAITQKADGTYDVSHSAAAYGVDSNGKIVIEWPFGTKGEQIATDIRILLGKQPGGTGK
ncbi:MAG: hypothetical protein DCC49_08960 [Acidobacteria bacterium]|nr:MAG: hypothetical protein DCC49_08960 [Acidobacteriota bacterium]